METRKLIIFRAPSGAGKSTAAKEFIAKNGGLHFEADDYYIGNDGKYIFDATKIHQAHQNCQRRVQQAMQNGILPLVVSNTSMTLWELKPYLELAREFDYEVKIYRIKGPWDAKLFASRNVHNVTEAIVQKQIDKYQPLENEEEWNG